MGTDGIFDIYTEPDFDPRTLSNLGPLTTMAGHFVGDQGADVHPAVGGDEHDGYRETYDLEPIDAQTNGPQVLYGLRYHQRAVRHGEIETFHEQVGHWLFEPATSMVTLTLSIPRAQVALATGRYEPGATTFTVSAHRGSMLNGIASGEFLDRHFTTASFEMTVTLVNDTTWRYEADTVMRVSGRDDTVHHRDVSTLVRVAPPRENPTLDLD